MRPRWSSRSLAKAAGHTQCLRAMRCQLPSRRKWTTPQRAGMLHPSSPGHPDIGIRRTRIAGHQADIPDIRQCRSQGRILRCRPRRHRRMKRRHPWCARCLTQRLPEDRCPQTRHFPEQRQKRKRPIGRRKSPRQYAAAPRSPFPHMEPRRCHVMVNAPLRLTLDGHGKRAVPFSD